MSNCYMLYHADESVIESLRNLVVWNLKVFSNIVYNIYIYIKDII